MANRAAGMGGSARSRPRPPRQAPSDFVVQIEIQSTRDDHRIAWLAALAIAIHVLESGLPMLVPGVKPGLANVITVAVLLQYGWRMAVWVSLLRVLVGSLVLGTFLSPTFALSLGGAIAAVLALGLGQLLPGRGFGPVGYSVLAATAHMAMQFALAYILFVRHEAILVLLPVLMSFAVLSGIVNGIIAGAMLKRIAS